MHETCKKIISLIMTIFFFQLHIFGCELFEESCGFYEKYKHMVLISFNTRLRGENG